MSANLAFRDQIALLTSWFGSWNRCEQTIALVSLLRRVSWIQARFLRSFAQHVCESVAVSTAAEDLRNLESLERSANDPEHLAQLAQSLYGDDELKNAEDISIRLLDYVFLLEATNANTKRVYFELLERILALLTRGESNEKLIDVCRQLLSCILIHPDLNVAERQTALLWLAQCGQTWDRAAARQRADSAVPAPASGCSAGLYQQEPSSIPRFGIHQTDRYEVSDSFQDDVDSASLANDDHDQLVNGSIIQPVIDSEPTARIEVEHRANLIDKQTVENSDLINPQSLDSNSNPNVPVEAAESDSTSRNLRDIAIWLKALRLHKYTPVFEGLDFDGLLSISDVFLERKGVTRGARKKILMHIEKLSQRGKVLRELELEIVRSNGPSCFLKQVIDTLEQMLATPIRPISNSSMIGHCNEANVDLELDNAPAKGEAEKQAEAKLRLAKATTLLFSQSVSDDDIATLITRVLGKIYTQLLLSVNGKIDEVLATRYVLLIDRCCQHDAFTEPHRDILTYWRTQISEKAPIQRCKPVFVQPFKPTNKQMKILMSKTQLSSGYQQVMLPVGYQSNVNMPAAAATYYGGSASPAGNSSHVAVMQHRNSLPVNVAVPTDSTGYPTQNSVQTQQSVAAGTYSGVNTPTQPVSVWRSWAAASGNVLHSQQHSLSHSMVLQSVSPAMTPSSGSAMSSQLSLNSVEISGVGLPLTVQMQMQLAPRRGSCDVPSGTLPSNVLLEPVSMPVQVNDRNNNSSNHSLPPIGIANAPGPAAAPAGIVMTKRRFERTNSAPNQAMLFARLRQSAPVNLATSATIREQASVDQDDASLDGALSASTGNSSITTDRQLNARFNAAESERELDSLCMRMTEAALDG